MKYLSITWRVLVNLAYLAVVIGILSVTTTKFETLVLAGLIQLYAAVLYNFSVLGVALDQNNYAAFVRFRISAAAQGILENEDGVFLEQEQNLARAINDYGTKVLINRFANAAVSLYALFKIVEAIL